MAFAKFDPQPFLTNPESSFSSFSDFSNGPPTGSETTDAEASRSNPPEATQGGDLSANALAEPWRPAKAAKAAKADDCRLCGRPQHEPDIVCPNPTTPDPRYPVAPGYAGLEPERWDEALADAWLAITLERVGKLHDELAPDCDIDTPEWDRVEAVVTAAYLVKSRQGLRDALDAYEQHARATFEAWAQREAA